MRGARAKLKLKSCTSSIKRIINFLALPLSYLMRAYTFIQEFHLPLVAL
jgi:hypothetical protein